MFTFVRIAVFALGLAIVVATVLSATKTFVLPRAARTQLTRTVFRSVRWLFDLRLHWTRDFAVRDRWLALYAPLALLMLPVVWLTNVLLAYTAMFWALGVTPWRTALATSGSSLLTLGFATVKDLPTTLLAFSEAVIGLILVALLIAYLPAMYAAFAKREAAVTLLEVRAGSPPSASELFLRYHRLQRLEQLGEIWVAWEVWFAELEESHTSLAALSFFRSPNPERSWVTAAGAVLDAAALAASTLDIPRNYQADLCIRAGYLALQEIAKFFGFSFNPHPNPTDPISISRQEYDEMCEQLAHFNVPLVADRDAAWQNFAGWRVNYDVVLLSLARLTSAPIAPWSSDRMGGRPTTSAGPTTRQLSERVR